MGNFTTYTLSFIYDIKDLDGKRVPDSKITPYLRDNMFSNGDYEHDCKVGVCAYLLNKRIPLQDVNLNKNIVKYIAGLWRVHKKPKKSAQSYKIISVWDKKVVLGNKLDIQERDDFGFEYYKAAEEKYNAFGILVLDFNLYVAKCDTKDGPMLRYGATREDARAFLRGAISDKYSYALVAAAGIINKQSQPQKE